MEMRVDAGEPKWRRRKEARPAEIVAAALEVFSEKGFAAARLDDIAARAGVSKGALYLYFETKQDLFRAVVRDSVAPNLNAIEQAVSAVDLPFAQVVRMLLSRMADVMMTTRLPSVAKVVIAESRNFPDLARIWHDDVVSRALGIATTLIERAQAKGEVKPGEPRIYAFSLAGPMLMGALWREVFEPVGARPVDLREVARQHAETALQGMLL
jgi:AcrR family transcriptional regulator